MILLDAVLQILVYIFSIKRFGGTKPLFIVFFIIYYTFIQIHLYTFIHNIR
jgi:hypothetical protein